MDFSERLFSMLMEMNLTNADLSKATKLTTTRISNYYNGIDMPNLDNALALANYFKCTLNYLFCLTDQKETILEKRIYKPENILTRLKGLILNKGISQRQFFVDVNLSKSSFTQWRNGQKPKITSLIKMAKYFDCTIDYILGY